MSGSLNTAVLEFSNTTFTIFKIQVVKIAGKLTTGIVQLASNTATPPGCHFSTWRTKSGASALLDRYNPVETLTSSAITSQVLTVSDSTCQLIVAQLEPLIAQVTLRVPSISTEPSVSKALIEVVQFTV